MAPVRLCEVCNTYNHASARVCVNCGHEFPRGVKIQAIAGSDALIRRENDAPEYADWRVDRVVYQLHEKADRPDSIKATYYCGMMMARTFICLEHEGFASKKARDWWRLHSNMIETPATTAEALASIDVLRTPVKIRVQTNLKHPEIQSYEF